MHLALDNQDSLQTYSKYDDLWQLLHAVVLLTILTQRDIGNAEGAQTLIVTAVEKMEPFSFAAEKARFYDLPNVISVLVIGHLGIA